jgi:hypothetical protein
MRSEELPPSLLEKLSAPSVQSYLRARGWVREERIKSRDIGVYKILGKPAFDVIVPHNRDFPDYSNRMADVIEAIATLEQRKALEILNDLLAPAADVVRLRLDTPTARDGTVPLVDGLALFTKGKQALETAAYDELKPQKFHPRLNKAEPDLFISSCRLGQTERGSFVASFICPVNQPVSSAQIPLIPMDEVEGFGRKVTARFMRAVAHIEDVISSDQADRLVNPKQGDLLLSANFLDSLLSFPLPDEKSVLRIACAWAPNVPMKDERIPDNAEFKHDYLPLLSDAVKRLMPSLEPKRDKFIGKIDVLRGTEREAESGREGEVVFSFQEEDQLLKVKLDLSAENYAKACDAHKLSKYVAVRATLVRQLKIHHFEDLEEFSVLD